MTAAPRMILASLVCSFFRSLKTRAVIPTLVAYEAQAKHAADAGYSAAMLEKLNKVHDYGLRSLELVRRRPNSRVATTPARPAKAAASWRLRYHPGLKFCPGALPHGSVPESTMGFGGISIWQLLIILVIVLLLFGTKRLRNLGGDLGNAVKGFKKAMGDEEKKDDKAPEELEKAEEKIIAMNSFRLMKDQNGSLTGSINMAFHGLPTLNGYNGTYSTFETYRSDDAFTGETPFDSFEGYEQATSEPEIVVIEDDGDIRVVTAELATLPRRDERLVALVRDRD